MTDTAYDRAWTDYSDFVASEGTPWPFAKKVAKAVNSLRSSPRSRAGRSLGLSDRR